MSDRQAELVAFLRETAGQPFVWGERDCLLWPGAWIERCTGRNPAARFVGTYANEAECHRIVDQNGGILAFASAELEAFGLTPTETPQPGDFVIVNAGNRQVGAIKTAKGVAVKTLTGVAVGRLAIVAAWSV